MIDIRASKPLAKVIGARRETQRHLECLTRQIMARMAINRSLPLETEIRPVPDCPSC